MTEDRSITLGMMAVGASEVKLAPFLDRLEAEQGLLKLQIGCFNSPESITLSGDSTQIDVLQHWLKDANIFARKLRVNVAYHSNNMQDIAKDYAAHLQGLHARLEPREQQPFISSVTGAAIDPSQLLLPDYWVRNMVSPVKFSQTVSHFLEQSEKKQRKVLGSKTPLLTPVDGLLEIGPHPALRGPVQQIKAGASSKKQMPYLSTLDRNVPPNLAIANLVGRLYCFGYPVNLTAFNKLPDNKRYPVATDLPEYSFNHSKSYWNEGRLGAAYRFRKNPSNDLLGTPEIDWNPLQPRWRNLINNKKTPWIEDHKVS